MQLSAILQRLQFLKTTWKKIAGLVLGLPRIVLIGGGAILFLALVVYVWLQTKSLVDVGLLLGIAAFVALGLWLIARAIRARGERLSSAFDEQLQGTEMLDDLRSQWNRATGELKAAGVDRYNMSFYMLIGEPQSGKTTTLQKSGLNFPIGMDKIQGIGGTRNLDWWFTDEAVILDTAGRLTFQENQTTDEAEWNEFLSLLAKYRPKAPVNGVIVTIPCTSLLDDSAEVRERKAEVIRKALVGVERGLGVQFPVWVLVTKADRIGGFSDFFGRLKALEQSQLLGWSRPKERFGKPLEAGEMAGAFASLTSRLRRWRVFLSDQFGDEMEADERHRMLPFPDEFACIEKPLTGYIEQIFPESKLLDPLFFRGFYVTSGVQKGEPVLQAAARILGRSGTANHETLARMGARSERAYFIRDFYRKKVFPERGLIVPTAARVRKAALVQKLGYGAATAAAVLGTIWVGIRWANIRAEVTEPVTKVTELVDAYAPRSGGSKDPDEAMRVLTALEGLGKMPVDGESAAEGEGVLPAITRGDLLGTRGFLKVGSAQQDAVRDGIVRALRVGLNDGVVAPLAAGAIANLGRFSAEADGEGQPIAMAESMRLRIDGVLSMVEMLLEQDRSATDPAPAELDGFVQLAVYGDESIDAAGLKERVRGVYATLMSSYRPSIDDTLAGTNERWRGLGLTAGLVEDEARLKVTLPGALASVRRDALALLDVSGDADRWFDPAVVPTQSAEGGYEDREALARLVQQDSDEARRFAGYLFLRAATLSIHLNESLLGMSSVEDDLVALRVDQAESADALTGRWIELSSKALFAVRELESIQSVLSAGTPTDFAQATGAALTAPNAFARSLREVASARESKRWAWVTDMLDEAGIPPVSDGPNANWISHECSELVRAARVLGGDRPYDWGGSSEAEWVSFARLESIAATDDGDPSSTLKLMPDLAARSAAILETRRLMEAFQGADTALVDAQLLAMGDEGAVSLRPKAWKADGGTADAPLTALRMDWLSGPASPVRERMSQLAMGRVIESLTAALSPDRFQVRRDLVHDAFVSPAQRALAGKIDLEDGFPVTDPAYGRVALDATLLEWLAPMAEDLVAVQNAAGDWSGAEGALERLDGIGSGLIADWRTYWATEQPRKFVERIEDLCDADETSWSTLRGGVRDLVDAGTSKRWTAKVGHYRDRVRAGMTRSADGSSASAVDEGYLARVESLPATSASLGRLLVEQTELIQGDSFDAEELEGLAKLFFSDSYDFHQLEGARWRRTLKTQDGRAELIAALEPVLGDAAREGSLDEVSSPFRAIDHSLQRLGVEAHRTIAAELVRAIREDYAAIQGSSAARSFPFAPLGESGVTSADDDRRRSSELALILGEGGRVERMIETYRPLGLLPYVMPDDRANPRSVSEIAASSGGDVFFARAAETRTDIVVALSELEDLASIYARRTGDGGRGRVELQVELLETGSQADIYNNIVRLSVSTQLSGWEGTPGERLRHLRPDDVEPGRLEILAGQEALALRFSLDSVGTSTAFQPNDAFRFPGLESGAEDRTALRYSGGLALFEFLEEARLLSGAAKLDRKFMGGLGDDPRRTRVVLPLRVNYRVNAGAGSGAAVDLRSGDVLLRVEVEDLFVPATPIRLPEWE